LWPDPVPDEVRFEVDDFLHECIAILNRCSNINDEQLLLKAFELALEDKSESPSILFSLLALVLVSSPKEDVAAVTAYQTKSAITVYFTKNDLSEGAIQHVNDLAKLVRNTALDQKVNLKEFYKRFFKIVLPYCQGKIFRRLDEMRKRLDSTKRGDDFVLSTFDDLLGIYQGLRSDPNAPEQPKGNADKEAIRLSVSNNLYEGLCDVLKSVKIEATSDLFNISADTFVPLAAHAYIVGYASINTVIARSSASLVPLMRSFQKVGDYFRCATGLFRATTDSVTSRRLFAELTVVPVHSVPPIERTMKEDWMHVLRVIWFRQTGHLLPITKGQWLAKNTHGMALYQKHPKQKFVAHAELTLMTAVVDEYHRTPTVVGVSKACCGFCTAFVDGVNQYREKTNSSTWHMPGSHGNCYVCQFPSVSEKSLVAGMAHLQEYLESKIVDLIRESIPLYQTETPPPQWSNPEESHPPNGSNFPFFG